MNSIFGRSLAAPFIQRLVLKAGFMSAVMLLLPTSGIGRAAAAETYAVIDLGTLGGLTSQAFGINNSGHVVGESDVIGGRRAFLYDGGQMRDLGTLGGGVSIAHSINDAGQIVGESLIAGNLWRHAFLYENGVMRDLGLSTSAHESKAFGINASGQIVGYLYDPLRFGGAARAFLGAGGVFQELDFGAGYSEVGGINASGWVVGRARAVGREPRALLYDGATVRELGTLGGPSSLARAINDLGQVVGDADTPLTNHAFLYDGSGMRDLGTIGSPFTHASHGRDINNSGQVVGNSFSNGGPTHGFIWENGTLRDLNALRPPGCPWEILEANSINDRGQIAAVGVLPSQSTFPIKHALLLSPVSVTPLAAPQAPAQLVVATSPSHPTSQLDLRWSDTSNNENGFEIERRQHWQPWTKVAVVPANTTRFTDNTGLGAFIHYIYRVRATNSAGNSAWTEEAGADTGIGARASIGRLDHDFGNVPLGSVPEPWSLTITNTGTGPLEIQEVALEGADAAAFSFTVDSPTIAPAETGTITIRFTPSAIRVHRAGLVITSNAVNSLQPVGLTGTGTAALVPTMGISPNRLSFGQEPVGLSGTLSVLLHNTGPVPVQIGSISILGPDAEEFSLPLGNCSDSSLAPGTICLLNVRFSPTHTGSRSATLVIPTNAAGGPQMVALTGTGTAPLLRLNTDSLTFPVPSPGGPSASETVTITNHGDAPLNIEGLSLAGTHAGSFQIVSDSGQESLDPGASRTVKVAFRPAQINSARRPARIAGAQIASVRYNASLQIRHNDTRPGSPQQVALTAVETAPLAPATLRAVATSPKQVELHWSDTSPNETEFVLMRKPGSGLYGRIAVLPPNQTRYTDTTASPNTAYSYILKAANTVGASPWSNEAPVTTPRQLPPAAPTPLQATAISPTQVSLSWTDRSSEREFVLLRKLGSGLYQRLAVLPANATSYTDNNVVPNTTYSYIMRAVNEAGVSAWTNEPSVTTPDPRPAKPTNVRAVAISSSRVNLTWEDKSSNETQFVLLRKVGNGVYQRIAVLGANTISHSDTAVTGGLTYTYILRAVNEAGFSAWTNELSVTTPDGLPIAPTPLRATAVSSTRVELAWTDRNDDETGFVLLRKVGAGLYRRIAVLAPNTTAYTDNSVAPNTSYTYIMRAINDRGVSAWTNEPIVTTP